MKSFYYVESLNAIPEESLNIATAICDADDHAEANL